MTKQSALQAVPDQQAQEEPPAFDPELVREELAKKGLWAKVAWVQQHVLHVERTGSVSFGSGPAAKVMQEHGLLGVLRPLWRIAGLAVVGGLIDPEGARVVDLEVSRGNQYRVDYALTVTDIDNPEQTVTRYYPNIGNDNGDKGFNKAYTAGNKYALQKFFQVPTLEIDDNDAEHIATTVPRNTQGAAVSELASRKPPAEELEVLRGELRRGVAEQRFDTGWVVNTLTAEFGVSSIDELTKPQFRDFSAAVSNKIAGSTEPAPAG